MQRIWKPWAFKKNHTGGLTLTNDLCGWCAGAMAMFSFSSYLFTSYAGCYFWDFSMIVNGHETSKTYKMNDVEYPIYLYRNYGPNHWQVNNRIS